MRLALAIALALSVCGPLAAPTALAQSHWYDGGTLHRASMGQWMAASYANRLATASDFAARSILAGAAEAKRENVTC